MIIEKATGSKLSTQFGERFWLPLGITNAYLSIQEEIPENRAHIFGDNFRNDGSWQDTTFFPRASHDSIGFGSGGLFMAAEDLAKVGVQKLDEYARKYRTDTLWFDTLKISGDSVVENQKAAVLIPYVSTGEQGSLYFTREELAKMAISDAVSQ